MIKVIVWWDGFGGNPKTYTLREFQEIFNSATDGKKCAEIDGDQIHFIIE